MNNTVPVACIYCGIVFESNVDELGLPVNDECNDCWNLEEEDVYWHTEL